MKNFKPLSKEESNDVWNKFFDLFHFKPNLDKFPAIETDKPQLKFNVSNCFRIDYPHDKLEQFALNLFNIISMPGDRLYALDWQHQCYDFDPRELMDRNDFDEWIIPVFPNGGYYIFLTKDLRNVWFGHPWEQSITLIGEDMVKKGHELKYNFPK